MVQKDVPVDLTAHKALFRTKTQKLRRRLVSKEDELNRRKRLTLDFLSSLSWNLVVSSKFRARFNCQLPSANK